MTFYFWGILSKKKTDNFGRFVFAHIPDGSSRSHWLRCHWFALQVLVVTGDYQEFLWLRAAKARDILHPKTLSYSTYHLLQVSLTVKVASLPWSVLVAGFQFSAEMMGRHTWPRSSILGWYIFVLNTTLGGLNGYSAGKFISIRKAPLLYGGLSCEETWNDLMRWPSLRRQS